MKRYYKLLDIRAAISAFGALLLLASCSSYQYAGYENDGIYSSSTSGEAYTANDYEESYEDALYYKQLFAEKADQFGNVPEQGAIFTNIEGYSSMGSGQFDEEMFPDEGIEYQPGRAAWGSNPDEIAVNFYDNRIFHRPFMAYPFYGGYAGFYDPFWGPGYGYGFGYHPFAYGWGYGPFDYYPYYRYSSWNMGWGYGGFGIGYSSFYPYGGRYYQPYYYNNRNIAYSTSRRSPSYTERYSRSNNDSRSASRIQSYSNSRNVRAARSTTDDRTYQTRSTRVRSTSSSPASRTGVSSDNSNSRTVRSARSTTTTRSATTTRSSQPTQVRTTRSSSSNNSGTVRSSSSTSRSSGTTRSSGGSSRSSRGGR